MGEGGECTGVLRRGKGKGERRKGCGWGSGGMLCVVGDCSGRRGGGKFVRREGGKRERDLYILRHCFLSHQVLRKTEKEINRSQMSFFSDVHDRRKDGGGRERGGLNILRYLVLSP